MVVSVTLRIYPSIATAEVTSRYVFDRESVVVRLGESSPDLGRSRVPHCAAESTEERRGEDAHVWYYISTLTPAILISSLSIKTVYVQPPESG